MPIESTPAQMEYSDPVKFWLGQIEGAQKEKHCQRWYERGKAVIERYSEERYLASNAAMDPLAHRMNVLWSNVETIKPALYAKTPTPKVQRRYRDKDPVGKWGAIVLERANGYTFDAYDVDYAIRNAVQDYLLPGRGQIWCSYKPKIVKQAGPNGPDGKPTEMEKLAWECCENKHLNWKDFLTNPARTWDEVTWVAQRAYLSKEEVAKHPKFSKDVADKLSFTETKEDDRTSATEAGDRVAKAAIWEIWDKTSGLVYYVSKSCPETLAKPEPPPLDLEGFFPCPRPLTATTTTDSIIPTPDFVFYQNQAAEIDRLTQRINLLTKALRVAGVYDGTQEALAKLLDDNTDNVMIPSENWWALAANGGLDGSVAFMPTKEIIEALRQCYESREAAKQVMYEITGIADIVRGASDPRETAKAQQIKSQWGSLRIRDRQAEVQRFVRDIMRLNSEIIAEHFQLETLKTMSNCPLLMQAEKQKLVQQKQIAAQAQQMAAQNPKMAQQIAQANPQLAQMAQPLTMDQEQAIREPAWEDVYALLKDQKLRAYRIDIETDSTIAADDMEEKKDRTEFVGAMTAMVQAWAPIIVQQPKAVPLFGELMLFGARAFKRADLLESAIEETVDMLSQQALLPKPPAPPPDPKAEAETKRLQFEEKKHADEMGFRQQEMEAKNNFELQKQQNEIDGQVQIAKAGQPQMPPPEEVQTAMGPMFTIMQQMVQQAMQASIAIQAQSAQAAEASQQRIEQAIGQIAALAAAPRELSINRGLDGRIQGGTATPRRPN